MSNMNSVVHFELPGKDTKRMADFYSQSFGWIPNFLGAEMGHYVTVTTTEIDENRMPKKAGAINGGLYGVTPEMPPQHPSLVIAVDDIRQAMEKIKAAGGQLLGEPMEIPGIGQFVPFLDTEGNRLSILQPNM